MNPPGPQPDGPASPPVGSSSRGPQPAPERPGGPFGGPVMAGGPGAPGAPSAPPQPGSSNGQAGPGGPIPGVGPTQAPSAQPRQMAQPPAPAQGQVVPPPSQPQQSTSKQAPSWYDEDSAWYKFGRVTRRRWWSWLLLTVVIGGIYAGLGAITPVTYSATMTLVVPAVLPNQGQLPPGDPDGAAKNAKNLAIGLPLMRDMLVQAAAAGAEDEDWVLDHVAATNTSGSSYVDVTYEGTSAAATAKVLAYIGDRITGTKPPVGVPAGSVQIFQRPAEAVVHGGDAVNRVPLGIILGLVVASMAVLALERTSPHLDTTVEAAELLGVPVTVWTAPTSLSVARVVQNWDVGMRRNQTITLVGVQGTSRDTLSTVSDQINQALWFTREGMDPNDRRAQVRPRLTTVDMGSPDGSNPLELGGVFVMVLPMGVRRAAVATAGRRLRRQGAQLTWAIFMPPQGRRSRKAG